MKVITNKIIPFAGYKAINLFGILFVRKGNDLSAADFNHEYIHTEQMKELWYIPYYILYILECIIKFFRYGWFAYNNISFEREAYANMKNLYYLEDRKKFASFKYILKNS
jgi:hypothetical protein